eukprot:COSAG06_NODE_15731_length_1049_cov_2.646316_1_plen_44_part_01
MNVLLTQKLTVTKKAFRFVFVPGPARQSLRRSSMRRPVRVRQDR